MIWSFWLGFLSTETRLRSRSRAALVHSIRTVRGQVNLLVRNTMSVGCVRGRSGCPTPVNSSVMDPADNRTRIVLPERMAALSGSGKPAHPKEAATPIIQSPRVVRCSSLVNSSVVRWVPRRAAWPCAVMVKMRGFDVTWHHAPPGVLEY